MLGAATGVLMMVGDDRTRVIGPMLVFLFVFMSSLLCLNFYISFLLEGFQVARKLLEFNKEEPYIMNFIKSKVRSMMGYRDEKEEQKAHPDQSRG
ncbi:hypothetical protein BaRGS_00033317 [Batillaria attramentaria]|uniref:V-type proton ATPase subunit a n=1 Tax=Batillaria attramentaria TaxID=370345 RepID=A0ABD0JKQ2_9CAEN